MLIQSIRGMRDVLSADARGWRFVEDQIRSCLKSNAYEEIRLPVLEFKELFSRSVGEATDIVEKEMYNLSDRDGENITLRPEGTAGCVRALIENGLIYNQSQRVFYSGEMFRYERPQKGRYRQFYQIGAEAIGLSGPEVDAELIDIASKTWAALGIDEHLQLELNNLGSPEARKEYKNQLLEYLRPMIGKLDGDSQRRFNTNPLRILDSKNSDTQALFENAPLLSDFVDSGSKERFDSLCGMLVELNIPYVVNPRLVRGLDYYSDTVFEWSTDQLGAQGTVCGGGRYDGLVELLGGKRTPAAGFAIGLDRVVLLYQEINGEFTGSSQFNTAVDIYVCCLDSNNQQDALKFSGELREGLAGVRIRNDLSGGKLKNQLRRADQSGARVAVFVGPEEIEAGALTVKYLNGEAPQETDEFGNILKALQKYFGLR